MTSLVTIATVLPVKNTLNFPFKCNFRKFKVALKPLQRISFNFAKSCTLTCQSLFNNKKWGSPDSFLSYKHLKGKLRVFLTGKTVAIVTSDVMKLTTTYFAMIGHLFDIIIFAVLTHQSLRAGKRWKLLRACLSRCSHSV